MLFIEQPAGVGFSIPESPLASFGDASAASDNFEFLVGFTKLFPNFASHPLYVSSESYGGHYIPTLTQTIVNAPGFGGLNFKGMIVGNPLTYMPYRDYGQFATFAFHQLVPLPLWDKYIALGCAPNATAPATNPPAPLPRGCAELQDEMSSLVSGLDAYGIDFPVCGSDEDSSSSARANATKLHTQQQPTPLRSMSQQMRSQARAEEKFATLEASLRASRGSKGLLRARRSVGGYFPDKFEPCQTNWMGVYFNRKDVQQAIHATLAPGVHAWSLCSPINYSRCGREGRGVYAGRKTDSDEEGSCV